MHEMYLRQHIFTYSVCGTFIKSKERIQKFKETGDSRYIYGNELDKECFQHNMTYGDFKNLPKWTASKNVLGDTDLKLIKIKRMMAIIEVLLRHFTKFW